MSCEEETDQFPFSAPGLRADMAGVKSYGYTLIRLELRTGNQRKRGGEEINSPFLNELDTQIGSLTLVSHFMPRK